MDFIKAFFGVIAALGVLSIPAATVYMMLGIGAEAFAHADMMHGVGSCPSASTTHVDRTGVVG